MDKPLQEHCTSGEAFPAPRGGGAAGTDCLGGGVFDARPEGEH